MPALKSVVIATALAAALTVGVVALVPRASEAPAPSSSPTPLLPSPIPSVAYSEHVLNLNEKAFRTTINEYRVANGLQPLAGWKPLNALAYDLASKMAGQLSLANNTWKTFVGYTRSPSRAYSEVVAIGPDRTYVLDMWKVDASQNAVLLSEDAAYIGLAYANGTYPDGVLGRFWVVDVATEAGFLGGSATLQTPDGLMLPVLNWWGSDE